MPKEIVTTDRAPRPASPVSQAVKAGGFVYTAGILGRRPDGTLAEGMEGQARQVMENLTAILAAAGASLGDVLRCEVYVADLADMPAFNAVWQQYFGDNPPARVSAQVAGVAAGARLELTAVAYVGDRRG